MKRDDIVPIRIPILHLTSCKKEGTRDEIDMSLLQLSGGCHLLKLQVFAIAKHMMMRLPDQITLAYRVELCARRHTL
jgi:hypothetical protein